MTTTIDKTCDVFISHAASDRDLAMEIAGSFDGLTPTELWSGRVSNSEQFDQLMKTFAEMGDGLK